MNALQKYLAEQERQRVEQEAQAKPPFFNTFAEYVTVFPKGARWKSSIEQPSKTILLATYEDFSCVEGDYYIAFVSDYTHHKTKKRYIEIVINDGDDMYARKDCASLEEAEQELENLKFLAPFYCGTLVDEFGYRWD